MSLSKMENSTRDYRAWLYTRINSPVDGYSIKAYSKLLSTLFDIDYSYVIENDGNRYSDGIDLRYACNYETGIDIHMKSCTVLEMMVALAIRCEDDIMGDPELGDRASVWFWDMIKSLGLDVYRDISFNEPDVLRIVDIFMNNDYKHDGDGGLFFLPEYPFDLRTMEIWDQMSAYLDRLFNRGFV